MIRLHDMGLGQRIAVVVTATVLLLASIGALLFASGYDLISATDDLSDSSASVADLRELLSLLQAAESAERGYIIAADERYAEDFDTTVSAIPGQIAALDASLSRRPVRRGAVRRTAIALADARGLPRGGNRRTRGASAPSSRRSPR